MSNRYANDIKRIVGIDPNQSKLGATVRKSPIESKRGIAYVTASGSTASKGGTAGETQLQDTTSGTIDSGSTTTDADTSNVGDPSSGITPGPTSGVQDAEDIIDALLDESKVNSPESAYNGLEYSSTGSLNGINAKDCASGDDVEIRFKGDFVPPNATYDSNGNEITPDWDNANTPPIKAGYVAGTYWVIIGIGPDPLEGVTIMDVISQGTAALNSGGGGDPPYAFDRYEPFPPTANRYKAYFSTGSMSEINLTVQGFDCTSSPPDSPLACPIDAPVETSWPGDDKYVLKYENGAFHTSQYDSEVPTEYKNPASKVDFCFGVGRFGSAEASKYNGQIVYETSTSGGSPTGIIRVYDSAGALVSAFDSASGLLQAYRP